jgi:hypothetical protein
MSNQNGAQAFPQSHSRNGIQLPPSTPRQMCLQTVTFGYKGQFVEMEPLVPALCRLGAIEPARSWRGLASGSVEVGRFWMGLEPVVRILLQNHGYAVLGEEEELRNRPLLDSQAIKSKRLTEFALLETVCTRRRLLVRHDPAPAEVARLIGQVRWAWRRLQVGVSAKGDDEAVRLHEALGGQDLGSALSKKSQPPLRTRPFHIAVLVNNDYEAGRLHETFRAQKLGGALSTRRQPCRLTSASSPLVCTAFSPWTVRLQRADLVVVPTATDVLTPEFSATLARADHARILGLLDRTANLSLAEEAILAGVFGLREMVLPAHGNVETASLGCGETDDALLAQQFIQRRADLVGRALP